MDRTEHLFKEKMFSGKNIQPTAVTIALTIFWKFSSSEIIFLY